MSVLIPCRPDLSHYDMQVVLSNITYTLEFRWNTREGYWYMDIKDETEDPILAGIKVVIEWPLGIRTVDSRRPPGVFFAIDTTNQQRDPGVNDLGDRVKLVYFDESEL